MLAESRSARLEMAIVLGGAEKRGWARLRELAKYPFWQLTVARLRRDGCLAPTHTQLLESTEIITCQGGEQRSGRDPGPAEIEAIYEHRLDFLLDLSIDDVLRSGVMPRATACGGSSVMTERISVTVVRAFGVFCDAMRSSR